MASLFIKDHETAERVARFAERHGTTKTEVVRRAMTALEQSTVGKPDFMRWIEEYRLEHPLPPQTGRVADKAFFDALWDER